MNTLEELLELLVQAEEQSGDWRVALSDAVAIVEEMIAA